MKEDISCPYTLRQVLGDRTYPTSYHPAIFSNVGQPYRDAGGIQICPPKDGREWVEPRANGENGLSGRDKDTDWGVR